MPKGTRTPPRVDMSRDPVLGDRFTRRDPGRRAKEVDEGQARVAVGDRAVAGMRRAADDRRLAAARSAAAPAQVQRTDTARDVPLGDGLLGRAANGLRDRQRQIDEASNYAEGGYVTKAQTTSMPACAKGKKRK